MRVSLTMSIRIILKIFLAIQLLLLILRQMVDFAGIQWLMIMVNAVAIIVTITAFFGHLRFYGYFQVSLIAYNLFVICVYARVFTIPSDSFYPIYRVPEEESVSPLETSSPSRTSLLPSTQLLSFDVNSRSFWYVIVANHISNLNAHLLMPGRMPQQQPVVSSGGDQPDLRHHLDESLVDLCVQYIEISLASLHIFFSLLGIGLILLKYKLQRDKFSRNNDKTTPPLPPYTISPQMNHYMSYMPATIGVKGNGNSLYATANTSNSSKNGTLRRSKRRRSTRSLQTQKKKQSQSMNALNQMRSSTGSLRSISKQGHRKSSTSLFLNDTSFNTSGSRGGNSSGGGSKSPRSPNHNNGNSIYGTVNAYKQSNIYQQGQHYQHQQQQQRHSVYAMGVSSAQHAAKLLNSDSETDYYHTFTPPAYLHNGLTNPLYGKRSSYLDSETAI